MLDVNDAAECWSSPNAIARLHLAWLSNRGSLMTRAVDLAGLDCPRVLLQGPTGARRVEIGGHRGNRASKVVELNGIEPSTS